MESPRKFNDCYFYYYSTCTKGDNCVFRHEPAALGCETMCSAWQLGKCLDKKCNLRHMELRKNRKQIPCYWENQPGGCRKKHCPFAHKNPEARTDGIAPSQPAPATQAQPSAGAGDPIESMAQPPQVVAPMPAVAPVPSAPLPLVLQHELLWQQQQRQVALDSAILGVLPASSDLMGGRRVLAPPPHDGGAPQNYAPLPVDPLVVNFEEESDNESAPSSTPTKNPSPEDIQAKSQELLLLERIQAETAAYYAYDHPMQPERRFVKTNLASKYDRLSLDEISGKKPNTDAKSNLDFKILSLEEIRAKKRATIDPNQISIARKRKISCTESIGLAGKVIKVVCNNSVVYKKVGDVVSNDISNVVASQVRKRKADDRLDVETDDTLKADNISSTVPSKTIKLNVKSKPSKPKLIRDKRNITSNVKHAVIDLDSEENSQELLAKEEIMQVCDAKIDLSQVISVDTTSDSQSQDSVCVSISDSLSEQSFSYRDTGNLYISDNNVDSTIISDSEVISTTVGDLEIAMSDTKVVFCGKVDSTIISMPERIMFKDRVVREVDSSVSSDLNVENIEKVDSTTFSDSEVQILNGKDRNSNEPVVIMINDDLIGDPQKNVFCNRVKEVDSTISDSEIEVICEKGTIISEEVIVLSDKSDDEVSVDLVCRSMPDVVASCQKSNKIDGESSRIIENIDAFLDDEIL